jgi:hypothetical protein
MLSKSYSVTEEDSKRNQSIVRKSKTNTGKHPCQKIGFNSAIPAYKRHQRPYLNLTKINDHKFKTKKSINKYWKHFSVLNEIMQSPKTDSIEWGPSAENSGHSADQEVICHL